MIKNLLLRCVLVVNAVELEAKGFCIILRVRYPHYSGTSRALAAGGLCSDDGVFVELELEQRSYTSNNADAHGCRREGDRFGGRINDGGLPMPRSVGERMMGLP